MKTKIPKHNHKELGRRAECPACQAEAPDVENPDAPPGCTYEWVDTSVDRILVCRRHGFVPEDSSIHDEDSTAPCLARKSEIWT